MRSSIETLESRLMFVVTLTNGLPVGDADYYEAIVGRACEPSQIIWEGRNMVFEYTALLDLGTAEVSGASVVELSSFGTDAVPGTEPNTAVSTVTLVIDDNTPNLLDNPQITINVTAFIPLGETQFETTYEFSAINFNLQTAKLFQYWDCVSGDVTSDFVTIRGSIASNNLQLRTHNTETYNYSILQNGPADGSSILTGFAVGEYPVFKPVIMAGGYDAPPTGDFRIPAGTYPGLGAGYGPVPYAVPVLEYSFLSNAQATVTTWLSQTPGDAVPMMEVVYVPVLNQSQEFIVPDEYTQPDPNIGTEFGEAKGAVQHVFKVYNQGRAPLELGNTPFVTLTGDTSSFRVIRQPTQAIAPGAYSYFIIEYIPTTLGRTVATVNIWSNDTSTSPYTFKVFGGGSDAVLSDPYEDDNTPENAKQVSTRGVWKVHSIHQNSDVDWSIFELTECTDVLIETTAPEGDTRIRVYDSQFNEIGYDNDSGPGVRSKLYLSSLPAGFYYVKVDEFGQNATIPIYGLSVRTGVPVPTPPVHLNQTNGKLKIIGTDAADSIAVDIYSTSLRVSLNKQASYFPLSEVRKIVIKGNRGQDTIFVGAGVIAVRADGGGSRDVMTFENTAANTIFGGQGRDSIIGGAGSETLDGGNQADTIQGGLGNDYILGGRGDDELYGDEGDDTILGAEENDIIYGREGNDMLSGAEGDDQIWGEEGNDTVNGGPGLDILESGAGSNYILAEDGEEDTIYADILLDQIEKDTFDIVNDARS